jgi:hypothetical protein
MIRGRNLATTILLAAAVTLISIPQSGAEEQTPSPRMLLNLDLFTAPPDDHQGTGNGGSTSTLEQLRALRAMGYLSEDGPLPEVDESDPPPSPAAPAIPLNQGAQQ